jgi:hypothetical protein
MTQSAFEKAAEQARQASQGNTAPAAGNGSSLMEDDGNGGSSLFGGEKLFSLFNITIPGSAERTGIITKPPRDKHSTNRAGERKYWDADAKKVVTFDTGRPFMDTVIVLQTEYRLTPAEVEALGVDPLDVEDDKGMRGIFASGDLKDAIKKAIKQARVRTESEMVGMRLTVSRGKKVDIPGGKTKWTGATAKLERV